MNRRSRTRTKIRREPRQPAIPSENGFAQAILQRRFLFAALVFMILSAAVGAQTISGRVLTFDSAAVKGAVVLLRSGTDSSIISTAETDAGGWFSFRISDVGERNAAVSRLELHPNFPNPFNEATIISFSLARPSRVTIELFDLLGRRVRRLADGEYFSGENSIIWDGRSAAGLGLPPGVYYCLLRTPEEARVGKLMLGGEAAGALTRGRTSKDRFQAEQWRYEFASRSYQIDVIDTTGSSPRFESRGGKPMMLTKDTSVLVQVYQSIGPPWHFVCYLDVEGGTPSGARDLKIYEPYLYALLPDGLGRLDLRKPKGDWQVFTRKYIVGRQIDSTSDIADYLVLDSTNEEILVAPYAYSPFYHPVFLTRDGGVSWAPSDSGLSNIVSGYYLYNDIHRFLDFEDGRIAAGGTPIYISTDKGIVWNRTGESGAGGTVEAISCNKAGDYLIFGGEDDAGDFILSFSRDSGRTWNPQMSKFPYWYINVNPVVGIAVADQNNRIFICTAKDMLVSTDLGDNWIHRNFLNHGTPIIFLDPITWDHLYILSNLFFFVTVDEGQYWNRISGPRLLKTITSSLAYRSIDHSLYIYLNSGIWKYAL